MSEFHLHELLAHNRELISDTWYYFLTVHLAVFGIVHIANRRVSVFERFTLLLAYLGFLAVNYSAQADNYHEQRQLLEQIAAIDSVLTPPPEAWNVIDNLPYIYGGVAVLAAVIILTTSWGQRDA